ncbi:DUF742 domain-containing protein [Nocardia sp. ET3-3]|uniref:DUF742 domain-containing protein n=1 Tax=Nocardia terrae TaxID=2675851 RepID=A0A7K1V9H9_9NOCA|nr:DUF742 domain-containing protein [Nocardia terrae]MVU83132.1 DUF742 domain-containing protein [Nocardia terrae]
MRDSDPLHPNNAVHADLEHGAHDFVRPFVVTGGRTTPVIDGLRIETLVQAVPSALSAPLQLEQREVVRLCQQPTSIAEVAAALHVPVGVAKVIVSDLAAHNYLSVREAPELTVAAIERIRDLVRAL